MPIKEALSKETQLTLRTQILYSVSGWNNNKIIGMDVQPRQVRDLCYDLHQAQYTELMHQLRICLVYSFILQGHFGLPGEKTW